jgi:hypothetical protein
VECARALTPAVSATFNALRVKPQLDNGPSNQQKPALILFLDNKIKGVMAKLTAVIPFVPGLIDVACGDACSAVLGAPEVSSWLGVEWLEAKHKVLCDCKSSVPEALRDLNDCLNATPPSSRGVRRSRAAQVAASAFSPLRRPRVAKTCSPSPSQKRRPTALCLRGSPFCRRWPMIRTHCAETASLPYGFAFFAAGCLRKGSLVRCADLARRKSRVGQMPRGDQAALEQGAYSW